MGKVVVTAFLLFTVPVSSVAAKDADIMLNGAFSENVEMVDVNNFEVSGDEGITITKVIEESYYISDISDIKDTTIILQKGEETAEPRHMHKKVKTTIRRHLIYNDGSCEMIIYDAEYCAGCDTYWKGDVIDYFEYTKCPH